MYDLVTELLDLIEAELDPASPIEQALRAELEALADHLLTELSR